MGSPAVLGQELDLLDAQEKFQPWTVRRFFDESMTIALKCQCVTSNLRCIAAGAAALNRSQMEWVSDGKVGEWLYDVVCVHHPFKSFSCLQWSESHFHFMHMEDLLKLALGALLGSVP